MKFNFKDILEVLKKEYILYQEIYKLARRKQDAIINEKIDRLEEIVKDEEKYLQEIRKLERNRLELTTNHNMTDIINLVNKTKMEQLNDMRNQLKDLTTKLKEQNLLNNRLLKDSLALINFNMNLIKRDNNTNIYSRKGLVKQQANTFINKRA